MVFGEIVEPSTRAFLDEEEFPDYRDLKWKNEPDTPTEIKNLYVADTIFSNKILKTCLKTPEVLNETLLKEISIFKVSSHDFIIICNSFQEISLGEAVELVKPWILKAQNIFCLTTASTAIYFNRNRKDLPTSFIRLLSNTKNNLYPYLETPNLVTGFSANILSYCVHINHPCTLFVGYVDHGPIDSVIAKPFLDLLQKINLKPVKTIVLEEKMPSNNLYM